MDKVAWFPLGSGTPGPNKRDPAVSGGFLIAERSRTAPAPP